MTLHCYRCGESLARLGERLSRHDLCPGCSCELHVCRMCSHYDPQVPDQCREDDAERVSDKERANFCDYFSPSAAAFDEDRRQEAESARKKLEALFGDGDGSDDSPPGGLDAAEDLFRH